MSEGTMKSPLEILIAEDELIGGGPEEANEIISYYLEKRSNIHACSMVLKDRIYEEIAYYLTQEKKQKIDNLFRNLEHNKPIYPNLEEDKNLFAEYRKLSKQGWESEDINIEELKHIINRINKLYNDARDAVTLEALEFWRLKEHAVHATFSIFDIQTEIEERVLKTPKNLEIIWDNLIEIKGDCLIYGFIENQTKLKSYKADDIFDSDERYASNSSDKLINFILNLQDYLRDNTDTLNYNGYDHVRHINNLILKLFHGSLPNIYC